MAVIGETNRIEKCDDRWYTCTVIIRVRSPKNPSGSLRRDREIARIGRREYRGGRSRQCHFLDNIQHLLRSRRLRRLRAANFFAREITDQSSLRLSRGNVKYCVKCLEQTRRIFQAHCDILSIATMSSYHYEIRPTCIGTRIVSEAHTPPTGVCGHGYKFISLHHRYP